MTLVPACSHLLPLEDPGVISVRSVCSILQIPLYCKSDQGRCIIPPIWRSQLPLPLLMSHAENAKIGLVEGAQRVCANL